MSDSYWYDFKFKVNMSIVSVMYYTNSKTVRGLDENFITTNFCINVYSW